MLRHLSFSMPTLVEFSLAYSKVLALQIQVNVQKIGERSARGL